MKNIESYWNWTFKNKWYYIILTVYFLFNNSFRDYINGTSSNVEVIGNIIGLGFVIAVVFFFSYLIYKQGAKKGSK